MYIDYKAKLSRREGYTHSKQVCTPTKVFNVRKVDSTELSLCLFRCLANTPNPP